MKPSEGPASTRVRDNMLLEFVDVIGTEVCVACRIRLHGGVLCVDERNAQIGSVVVHNITALNK